MKTMLFISRHKATLNQIELAAKAGFALVDAGDLDAFAPDLKDKIRSMRDEREASAIACVHPLVAMAALGIQSREKEEAFFVRSLSVGVFNNLRREDGGFETTELVVCHSDTCQEERMGLSHVPFSSHKG